MNVSAKKRSAAYQAIHETITDVRISLKLTPERDVELAQIEHLIWKRIMHALNVQVTR